ncbi:MAG: hypothetical protein JXB88_25545 [Spirochaetales bacterium]|nr:hypothetical protein [Spirochaetales bacterium]
MVPTVHENQILTQQKGLFNWILGLFKLPERVNKLIEEVNRLRAWSAYWIISAGINRSVYFRNSIGRNITYCNVAVYDLLDCMSEGIWRVKVQVGASLKIDQFMGQEIRGFDFDISPVMRERNVKNILSSAIPLVYDQGIEAAKQGEIRMLTQAEAQEKANTGVPSMIISKKINHVAIACPNFQWDNHVKTWMLKPYDPEKGCFTGNAGWINDLMYMSDPRGFGSSDGKGDEIKYFEFRSRTTGEFLT